jgi:hypothetical protein
VKLYEFAPPFKKNGAVFGWFILFEAPKSEVLLIQLKEGNALQSIRSSLLIHTVTPAFWGSTDWE